MEGHNIVYILATSKLSENVVLGVGQKDPRILGFERVRVLSMAGGRHCLI